MNIYTVYFNQHTKKQMMEKHLGHHLKTHTDRHEEKKHTADEYQPMLILTAIVYNILIWVSLKLLLLSKNLST